MNRKIVLLAILMVSGTCIFGQTIKEKFVFNPKVGIGLGLPNQHSFSTIFGVELSTSVKEYVISMDYYYFNEITLFGETPDEEYNQIGFMFGKYKDNDSETSRLQLQGGFAPIWGTDKTKVLNRTGGLFGFNTYETENFFTLGLVMKMGLKLIPEDNFGIGFDIQANLNHRNPMLMFMVSIEIGNLK